MSASRWVCRLAVRSGSLLSCDIKGKLYSRYGVRDYWIADPDAHSIEVLNRQENELRLVQTYVTGDQMTSPLLVGFRLALSEVFKAFP